MGGSRLWDILSSYVLDAFYLSCQDSDQLHMESDPAWEDYDQLAIQSHDNIFHHQGKVLRYYS